MSNHAAQKQCLLIKWDLPPEGFSVLGSSSPGSPCVPYILMTNYLFIFCLINSFEYVSVIHKQPQDNCLSFIPSKFLAHTNQVVKENLHQAYRIQMSTTSLLGPLSLLFEQLMQRGSAPIFCSCRFISCKNKYEAWNSWQFRF